MDGVSLVNQIMFLKLWVSNLDFSPRVMKVGTGKSAFSYKGILNEVKAKGNPDTCWIVTGASVLLFLQITGLLFFGVRI